ncbi:MAG: peroxiredoxin family protein [Planctomycetes bacterium]|nr:peroxiredoxin family protein [Planctomycetota bacterium]
MVQLQENLEAIAATDTQVVAISYDSVAILKKFAETSGITFPLLSDPDSATIRAFGIHNKKGLPHPGTYVIGADRKVLAAIFIEGYVDRHTAAELVETIGEIGR